MRGLAKKTFAAATALLWTSVAFAQEQVGQATLVKTSVSGGSGALAIKSPVHRDERITTSQSGLGEFLFRDGTKFAVGGNSSVVIDRFVFDDSNTFNQLTLNAARGSFRWISGKTKSQAYEIVTPAGTIGVRGTRLDIFVGPGGETSVVLLEGAAEFCGANGCQQLRRRCDVVVATPGGGVSDPARVNRGIFQSAGNSAFPFLSGRQRLTRGFYGFASGSCGLSRSGPGLQLERSDPGGADRPERPQPGYGSG